MKETLKQKIEWLLSDFKTREENLKVMLENSLNTSDLYEAAICSTQQQLMKAFIDRLEDLLK